VGPRALIVLLSEAIEGEIWNASSVIFSVL